MKFIVVWDKAEGGIILYSIGDVVQFGIWPQKGPVATPVEWYVIQVAEQRILLLSRYILDVSTYNEEWRESGIRRWLNSDFYDAAFSDEEKSRIQETVLLNDSSVFFEVETEFGGKWPASLIRERNSPTRDRVFILEAKDILTDEDPYSYNRNAVIPTVEEYDEQFFCNHPFASVSGAPSLYDFRDHLPDSILVTTLTENAEKHQSGAQNKVINEWWLRNKGKVYVCPPDSFGTCGYPITCVNQGTIIQPRDTSKVCYGIRPAMWLKSD